MTDLQFPAHLLQRRGPSVAAQLALSLPAVSVPTLSILGGRFTLKDATGNERTIGQMDQNSDPKSNLGVYVDLCIIDSNPHLSQEFYDRPYDENTPGNPVCFSDNGIAPSWQAQKPQSATCELCPQFMWVQGLGRSGGMAKACKAKQKIAVVVPGFKDTVFLLRVPTTSLKGFGKYVNEVKSIQVPGLGRELDVSDLITRVYFSKEGVGMLGFAPHAYVDLDTIAIANRALETKATDILVGKNDRPYTGEITVPAVTHAPQQERALAPPMDTTYTPPPPLTIGQATTGPFAPAATGVTPGVAAARSEIEAPKKARGRPPKKPVQEAPATQAPFVLANMPSNDDASPLQPSHGGIVLDDGLDIPPFLTRVDGPPVVHTAPTPKPAGSSFGMQAATPAPDDMQARISAILGMKT